MNHPSGTQVPFNRPFLTSHEEAYLQEVLASRRLCGDGPFTRRCQDWLTAALGCEKVLLTPSCTAALEMTALLTDVAAGDEVIMPSFTFVSTANAFVLRGAVPVFVDIRPDTLNIDESLIERAITPRTKVIVPVHYAGVGCAMDAIMDIARRHDLLVIEDAAQGLCATHAERPLGSIGHLGVFSFHETKNVVSGEGGALAINASRFAERAEILWEKGTNRRKFLLGQVDKYTWTDVGSSFLPSEFSAAVLMAQLEASQEITQMRHELWGRYHQAFAELEARGLVRRPIVPEECRHNAHIYYLLLPTNEMRDAALRRLQERNVQAAFHYVPLHSSPAGQRFGRADGALRHTDDLSSRLLRLPMSPALLEQADQVIAAVLEVVGAAA
ncbi:dTDP-4-amino-4,6-dideoxygalactose transaminase [Magnetospirillum fulvum]|uniref:dTDP-4-amino-4,6-dideoxygalactose transaminase n=1 Tax=Magnetospirillum fulvum TaxID=1082 RepID=A0A1H6H3M7_MAGFU|nr:dTDP-4-amino-4,6-dideoxygalactose transaminase [Magnetospirillum fulvum]SEH30301.1 dTDP-4-amino-4,6-dideoxygalactose transaminase [Magnetospirillum fulvum]